MKKVLRTTSQIVILILTLATLGCDSLTLQSDEEGAKSADFVGITSAKMLSTNDTIVLNWNVPKNIDNGTVVEYEVYVQELTSAEAESGTSLAGKSSSNLNLGERSGQLVRPTDTLAPVTTGRLVKALSNGELSYEIGDILPTSGYAFQVIAYINQNQVGSSPDVLILSSGLLGDYKGCTAASAVSASEVKVEFDYPDGASEVTILRDGQPIYVALNPEETYFDRNLAPERLYEYSCEALVGNQKYPGTQTFRVTTPDPLAELDNFQGCVLGTGVDASRIKVDFEFPSGVDSMTIYRGGLEVFTSTSSATTTFTDTGLSEGVTYTYKCYANVSNESKVGSKILTVATLSSNPPTFAGITSATVNGANSVLISWGVSTGVPASEFRLYGKPGSSLNFTADELLDTQTDSLSKVITNIGDELQYTYGVLACTASNQCAGTGVVRQLTLSDLGAPTTTGASAVALVSSQVELTVPYAFSNGAVAKRKIYRKTGGSGTTSIGDYTLIKTEAIASPYTTVATTLTDATISQNTTYHYIVRDEDPTGNTETNTSFVTIAVSDLTAPSFPIGIDALQKGSAGNEESELTAKFTAIVDEATDSVNGASHYVVYTKSGGGDACASGTEFASLDATSYTNATQYDVAVTGLTARTNYAICIKAKDSSDNFSATTKNLTKMTLDTTAPSFDGVQGISYNSGTSKFDVSWNSSTSSDIDEYKVQIWKNTATPGSTTEVRKAHGSFGSGFSFDTGTFTYVEGDTLYIIVDGCDDADTITDGTENCTSTAYSAALTITVPDITPPASFAGVSSTSSSSEGGVTYNWNAPPSWADYAGFYLYTVDPADDSLTQVKNCPCTGNDCATNNLLACTWTLGDPNRNYRVHVRAYDTTGNATTYLDPASNYLEQLTVDSTAPSFSGTPSVALSGSDTVISYGTATDNQYSGGGAVITYKIWRKADSDFADTNNPVADADGGAAVGSVTTTSYTDSTVTDGKTYYYVVCAQDAYTTPNVTCSPSKDFYVDDVTPPVIASLSSSFTNNERTAFDLTWDISDNESLDANIAVNVYLHKSDDITDLPTAIGTYLQTSGSGVESVSVTGANYQYYHYLIVATDEANNVSTGAQITVTPASPGIVSTNLLANYDTAFFADDTFPLSSGSWLDLTGNGNDGTLSGGTSWNGTGSSSDPYRLSFDGVNGKVDLGTPLSGQSQMMVNLWLKPQNLSKVNSIIIENGGGISNGFSVQQAHNNSLNLAIGGASDYTSLVIAQNPVAYWKFSETGSTLTDYVGSHNATIVNSPTLGISGYLTNTGNLAASFTSDEYATVADHTDFSNINDNLTIEGWVNLGGESWKPYIFKSSSVGFWKYNTAGSTLTFEVQTASGWTSASFNPGGSFHGTWHHVAGVWERGLSTGRVKLYIDGVEVASEDGYNEPLTTLQSIGIAESNVNTSHDRKIDELAIYNIALSAGDISARYEAYNSCTTASTFSDSEWINIGALWDGTNAKLSINGRVECATTPSGVNLNGSQNLILGSSISSSNYVSGDIAQLQIYSSGTAADVKTNFDATANTFRETPLAGVVTDSLVLQLDPANAVRGIQANADDTCDATVKWFDLSGSENDGTLTNFSSCGDTSGWNGDGSVGDPYSLQFDGVNDYVDLGDPSFDDGVTDNFAMEVWVKKSSDCQSNYDFKIVSQELVVGSILLLTNLGSLVPVCVNHGSRLYGN